MEAMAFGYFLAIGIPFVVWRLNLIEKVNGTYTVIGLVLSWILFFTFLEELNYFSELYPFWYEMVFWFWITSCLAWICVIKWNEFHSPVITGFAVICFVLMGIGILYSLFF